MEGRPNVTDAIKNNGEITFVINTTEGQQAIKDSFAIRRNALAAQRVLHDDDGGGASEH